MAFFGRRGAVHQRGSGSSATGSGACARRIERARPACAATARGSALRNPARCHAREDVAQQARRHPALGLHVVHLLPDEHRGNLRATPIQP